MFICSSSFFAYIWVSTWVFYFIHFIYIFTVQSYFSDTRGIVVSLIYLFYYILINIDYFTHRPIHLLYTMNRIRNSYSVINFLVYQIPELDLFPIQ